MSEANVVLGEQQIPVGKLTFESDGRRQHSSFQYAQSWLDNPASFDLAPSMPRSTAAYIATGRTSVRDAIHAPFGDTSPDSWGRGLMRKLIGEGATEFDVLVRCNDTARQGALRFVDSDGMLLSHEQPPLRALINLEDIRHLSAKYESNPNDADQDVRELASAAGSLGGARPKANVTDGSDLWIAKFTSINDTWPVERLEIATLKLAKHVGIRTPTALLELSNSDHPVALINRFDRTDGKRIPYISARTALGLTGDEGGYYTDIADALQLMSIEPAADIVEIWMRMVFGILVTNTDDHMKNHGLLYDSDNRWRLAPMFDVNPQPRRHPHLETGISPLHGHEPDIDSAIDAAAFFTITDADAKRRVRKMAQQINVAWRPALRDVGITGAALSACAPAFEHDRMEVALSQGH